MNARIQTSAASPRLSEVDVARALAAVAVVALHAIGYSILRDAAGSAAEHVDQVLLLAFRFARQVFMCISGFTLAYAYRDRPINYRTFVGRRAWRIALPYLAWSGIYLIVFPQDGLHSAAGFISVILYGTAFYHLYFVVVSIQWYVIFPFVLPLANRLRGRGTAVATVAVTTLSLGLAAWFTAGAALPAWASPLNRLLPHWDTLLVSYLGYYLLGTLGGIHAEGVLSWLRRYLWLVAAAMAGLLGYLMLDLVQDGFAHITRAGGKAYTWLLVISGNSFAIYLAHPLILFLVESYLLSRVHSYSPILSAPLILVAFLVPHGLSILLKSTPLAPVLLGQGSWRQPRRAESVRPIWAEQLPSQGD